MKKYGWLIVAIIIIFIGIVIKLVLLNDTSVVNNKTTTTNIPTGGSGVKIIENEDAKIFTIDASKFQFSIKEIKVKEDDKVKIILYNQDGFHDWSLDEFNARTESINTGETTSVDFVASKKGTFEYYCSVGNHRQMGMVGKLIVE